MRFGTSDKEHLDHHTNWHRWFAWRPVEFTYGSETGRVAWLEWVERKQAFCMYDTFNEYRPIPRPPASGGDIQRGFVLWRDEAFLNFRY